MRSRARRSRRRSVDDTKARRELGGPILAACELVTRADELLDAAGAAGAAMGGLLGSVAARFATRKLDARSNIPGATGGHDGNIFAAVGETRIVFFECKKGLFGASLGKLLARRERSDLAALEWSGGTLRMSTLTLRWRDGTKYVLDVVPGQRGKGERFRDTLDEAQPEARAA